MIRNLLATCTLVALAASAGADTPYAGQTIDLIVPTAPGGGYGVYAQLVVEHLPRHIPGSPRIRPEYMAGAGGLRAAHFVAEVAARDGSVIFMMNSAAPVSQVLFPETARFDMGQMPAIGIVTPTNAALVVRSETGVQTVDDLSGVALVHGATGRGSNTYTVPIFLNDLIDAQFNVVSTYSGGSEFLLAFERGEVQSILSVISTLRARSPGWLDGSDGARAILQVGLIPETDLPDVPLLVDLARDAEELALLRLMSHSNAIGRAFVMPPDTPEDRVEIIRTAFQDMLADPLFLADAERINVPVRGADAVALRALIDEALETPEHVLARAREVMAAD